MGKKDIRKIPSPEGRVLSQALEDRRNKSLYKKHKKKWFLRNWEAGWAVWRGLLAYFVLYFFVRGFMSGAHGANNFHGAFTDQFISERFWCEFRISLNSHKPVSKAYRPKNDNFYLLMTTLRFPFWHLTLRMRSTRGGDSIFVGKFALKCV